MKKLMPLLMATAFVFAMVGFARQASAIDLGMYAKGLLVPATVHDHGDHDTVIGIICSEQSMIWWTLFDEYSHHVEDGHIPCSKNDLILFSMNERVHSTKDGYMVFTANGDMANDKTKKSQCTGKAWKVDPMLNQQCRTQGIAGNAFYTSIEDDDAIFVPTPMIDVSDYLAGTNLQKMNQNSVVSLVSGFRGPGPFLSDPFNPEADQVSNCGWVDFRYWFNPEFQACTHVTIWTTACLNEQWKRAFDVLNGACFFDNLNPQSQAPDLLWCTVFVFDDEEHMMSLSLPLKCELHQFVPANDSFGDAWPGWSDGFIRMPITYLFPPDGSVNGTATYSRDYKNGAFGFSYITAKVHVKAAQTLLAAEMVQDCNGTPVDVPDNPEHENVGPCPYCPSYTH